MNIGWIYHDDYLTHETGPGHPERPDRLRALVEAYEKAGLDEQVTRIAPRPVDPHELHAIHDPEYVKRVARACAAGERFMDTADTVICPVSYDVARLAVGGVLAAMRQVMDGKLDRSFATVRPPGHHAEHDSATGFCLFNSIAIAADAAVREYDLQRVAVVDFDVHHGNGTQHAFERRADVLFISIHQDPRTLYPGSGFEHERGIGDGEGYTLNIPMAPGSGDADYRRAFNDKILPTLDDYKPQLLLIDVGFDAAAEDPLANINLTADMFAWMTRRLGDIADQHSGGRVVSALEGGYDLGALARCGVAYLHALRGNDE